MSLTGIYNNTMEGSSFMPGFNKAGQFQHDAFVFPKGAKRANQAVYRDEAGETVICCLGTDAVTGEPCSEGIRGGCPHPCVPYCASCMKNGDPSIIVKEHPRGFGRMVVAARDLPVGYTLALFGELYADAVSTKKLEKAGKLEPNDKVSVEEATAMGRRLIMPEVEKEWGFGFAARHDFEWINPVKYEKGSQVQYIQCCGPNETPNMHYAAHKILDPKSLTEPVHCAKNETHGAMLFESIRPIKQGEQLCYLYADTEKESDEFFAERGILRCDVWTAEHPTPLKKHLLNKDGSVKSSFDPERDLRMRPPPKSEGEKTLEKGEKTARYLNGSMVHPPMVIKKNKPSMKKTKAPAKAIAMKKAPAAAMKKAVKNKAMVKSVKTTKVMKKGVTASKSKK